MGAEYMVRRNIPLVGLVPPVHGWGSYRSMRNGTRRWVLARPPLRRVVLVGDPLELTLRLREEGIGEFWALHEVSRGLKVGSVIACTRRRGGIRGRDLPSIVGPVSRHVSGSEAAGRRRVLGS